MIKVDFKIEQRNGSPVGYPFLYWFYNGLRYEGLIDTGADNIIFPLDFLQVLDSEGIVNIDDIYKKNKFESSSGLGGKMLITNPIPLTIQLDIPGDNIFLDIEICCCLPKNKKEHGEYLSRQTAAPQIEQRYRMTHDTRLQAKLADEYRSIQSLKRKFNPPVLFGKPFLSKLKNINFVVEGENAEGGSYFEFEVRPEYTKAKP